MRASTPLTMLIISAVMIFGLVSVIPDAFATTWYPGEGLKQGDYYRYSLGDVNWHNGALVEMDFWVKNQTSNGLNLEMVVHDGSIIQKGIVTIGLVTPDPVSYDPNLADYANLYKLTLGWLDAFSTQAAPIDILSPVWGRAGLFGEATIGSVGMQTVTVPAGTFHASAITFRDSGIDSYIWADQTLPYPIKAKVYAIKTSGAPTIGFQFNMLENGSSQQPPAFLDVQSTGMLGSSPECPTPNFNTDSVHNVQTTDSNSAAIEYLYAPSVPHQGCPMDWRISFEQVYSATQKISDVHYDIYTVDNQGHELGSLAQSIGRTDIYSAVGDDEQIFIENQPPPQVHYVINIAGTGPASGLTDESLAGSINITVNTLPPFGGSSTTSPPSNTTSVTPSDMMSPTSSTNTTQSAVIPAWIKNNAGWWASGQIGDNQFVQGLQYMITNGMIKINS